MLPRVEITCHGWINERLKFRKPPLNYGVSRGWYHDEGGDAAIGGVEDGSEGEGGVGGFKPGVTIEVIEDADGLLRVGL
jgi:hypothetical protein